MVFLAVALELPIVSDVPQAQTIAWILFFALGTVVAIRTHRFVILGQAGPIRWGIREWRFFGLSAASILLPLILAVGTSSLFGLSLNFGLPLFLLILTASVYLVARLCLLFPSIAIDRPLALSSAMARTAPHQPAVLIVFILLPIPLTLLHSMADQLDLPVVSQIASIVAQVVGLVIPATALSVLYRHLCEVQDDS